MIKIASFNVENLFARAKAMSLTTWAEGKPILELYQSLNTIFQNPVYTDADKKEIVDGLKKLGLDRSDTGTYVTLRQNRGRLVKRPKNGPVQVVATGRADWIGWLELLTEPVDEVATRNTAQVIRDVGADVVGVVEAESRSTLSRFNDAILTPQLADAKRRTQADRVREIYEARRAEGIDNIIVQGDFNDDPGSDALAPLLRNSDLRDVSKHPAYENDGRPGTFGSGSPSNKIDYILLSPALFDRVRRGGVLRKGVWGGTHGTLWEIYPEMRAPQQAASDHAALWVELDAD